MKKYIRASKFSTTDDICSAVKKVFDGYITKQEFYSGSRQYDFEIGRAFGKGLSIIVGVHDTSYQIPRALYPSSLADNENCYFEILDNPENMPMLNEFQRKGFREACNYHNSQWGTYKVIIRSYDELLKVFEIFEQHVMNLLEGQE